MMYNYEDAKRNSSFLFITIKLLRTITSVFQPLLIPFAIYKLHKAKKITKLEELIDFTFNFKVNGLHIISTQIKEEIL